MLVWLYGYVCTRTSQSGGIYVQNSKNVRTNPFANVAPFIFKNFFYYEQFRLLENETCRFGVMKIGTDEVELEISVSFLKSEELFLLKVRVILIVF